MKANFQGLHALRAWAALAVVIFHLHGIPKLELSEGLIFVRNYLGQGVPLFFVISSFSLFLSTYPRKTKPSWVKDYTIRRFFRIAPLFYCIIIFQGLMIYFAFNVTKPISEYLINIFFIFNLIPGKHESLVWAGWTIGVEMIFYLVFPYLILFVTSLWRSLIFAALAIWLSIYFGIIYKSAEYPNGYSYMSFMGSFGIFAFGILGYFIFQKLLLIDSKLKIVLGNLLLVVSAALMIVIIKQEHQLIPHFVNRSLIWGPFFCLLIVSQCLNPQKFISSNWLSQVGQWSFSLYLLHPPLIYGLKPAYAFIYSTLNDNTWSFILSALTTLAILLPLAKITHRFIELPGSRWGEKLIAKNQIS